MLHLFLFNLQDAIPVVLLRHLNVRLRFTFLVLQRAVEQDNPRVLDSSPHLGVSDVLVDHDAVNDLTVLNLSTGDLLNTGVTLNVNLSLSTTRIERNSPDGLQGKAAHQLGPPGYELRSDGRLNQGVHGLIVVNIHGYRDLFDDGKGVGQSTLEGGNNNDGVDIAFELGEGLCKHFTS